MSTMDQIAWLYVLLIGVPAVFTIGGIVWNNHSSSIHKWMEKEKAEIERLKSQP